MTRTVHQERSNAVLAVLTGEMVYGAPYPLDTDKAAQVATRLGG